MFYEITLIYINLYNMFTCIFIQVVEKKIIQNILLEKLWLKFRVHQLINLNLLRRKKYKKMAKHDCYVVRFRNIKCNEVNIVR